MSDDKTVLGPREVEAEGLADWRLLFSVLCTRFDTGDFATALELTDRIGAAAEEMDHHPDVDLRYGRLDVRLSSHDVGGVTQRDIRLARTVSQHAAELGARAQPGKLTTVELALDVDDRSAVAPFWAAVLDLEPDDESRELVDPGGRWPTLWFQGSPEPGPQRFHLDVRVPPEEARRRIDAAVAAGGSLVDETHAPAFWVLHDARGNAACITTWQGRD